MKNKKIGFTLIELLAVIIVLAIIALIATPIIFNVIENAKIKSLENSCYGVIDAVRTKYAEGLLNSENGLVDLTGDVKDLTIAGEHPYMGTWEIDNSKDSDERGIKIQGVKFQSMKNYTCSNVDENGTITSKVSCEKDGPDEVQPTITAKQATVEVNKGTAQKIKDYFTVKFGKTGGQVTCEVENVSSLDAGDHTVKCTATGTNGKTAEATVKITVSNTVSNTVGLKSAILGTNNSNVIATDQTWTTSWQTSDQSGLYAQTVGGNKTYYFRGNPTNNYIKFAGKDYRILRVNEDGTIRIMLTDSIGDVFNSEFDTYDKMYYTNSELKTVVDNWFTTNITGDNASKVVSGNYFCEAARVAYDRTDYKLNTGSTKLTAKESYTPTFECTTDGNGKGVVTSKVGLVTYDETIYAGGWYYVSELSYPYYLNSGSSYWTMSPGGFDNSYNANAWFVDSDGNAYSIFVNRTYGVRPVLILSADTLVSGSGTSSDPYIVK